MDFEQKLDIILFEGISEDVLNEDPLRWIISKIFDGAVAVGDWIIKYAIREPAALINDQIRRWAESLSRGASELLRNENPLPAAKRWRDEELERNDRFVDKNSLSSKVREKMNEAVHSAYATIAERYA